MSDRLDPIGPSVAVEMYLESKQDELTAATLSGHTYRLKAFLQWCDESGIENLNELDGRELYEYRIWRREGKGEDRDPVATITLRGQLATIRAFLGFCEDINAVPSGLREKVPLPSVTGSDAVSNTTLEASRVLEILDYLGRYQYASFQHVMLLLMWHTGARVGGIRAIDLDDVDVDVETPGIEFVNRPSTETPLKNKESGERWNAISNRVARVLEDYIKNTRNEITDKYGRDPLLTTTRGRPTTSTLRDNLYRITRPCWMNETCPHGREMDSCEAWVDSQKASRCPSSRSPHDVRSGRVTAYQRNEVPRRVVSDRLNASEDVLDRHYDRRGEREKSEQRRDYLPEL